MDNEKKIKVLIAEENKELEKNIEEELVKTNEFEVVKKVNDGNVAMEFIKEFKPDIAIINLILSGKDGYTILEEIAEQNLPTKVIIISGLSQEVFISKAISLGASYYIVKPFAFSTLVERTKMIANSKAVFTKKEVNNDINQVISPIKNSKNKIVDEKITNIFISVGIPAHIKGYHFLREAIKMAIDSPEIINSITKKLYPSIAQKFTTSSSKVERAIRHAIEVAWNRGKIENINSIFGVKVYGSNDKPTNGEFIALVADKMLLEGA